MVGHLRQAREDIAQVLERIFPVALTRDDDGVDDGRALAGVGVPHEEPVLFSDARGSDGVLDQVGVQLGVPMTNVGSQWVPVAQPVVAGFSQVGLRHDLTAQCERDGMQPFERTLTAALAAPGAGLVGD